MEKTMFRTHIFIAKKVSKRIIFWFQKNITFKKCAILGLLCIHRNPRLKAPKCFFPVSIRKIKNTREKKTKNTKNTKKKNTKMPPKNLGLPVGKFFQLRFRKKDIESFGSGENFSCFLSEKLCSFKNGSRKMSTCFKINFSFCNVL